MSNASEQTLFRLRVAFVKQGRLKYLGHLEVIHTIEQIIRRAKLPYAVTQGFSPHMRIAYTSALPVGTSSTCEYFDVYLTELVSVADALERLRSSAPVDLQPLCAGYVELRRPALTAEITRVDYLIELFFKDGSAPNIEELRQSFDTLRVRGTIPYTRGKKHKELDIARTLESIVLANGEDAHVYVALATHCDNEGSLRPEIILAALDQALRGVEPGVGEEIVSTGIQQLSVIKSYNVERVGQYIVDEQGETHAPLEVALEVPEGSLLKQSPIGALSNL